MDVMKGVFFVFTCLMVTGMLVWLLRMINKVLTKPDPDKVDSIFLTRMLSFQEPPQTGATVSIDQPSSSRLCALLGSLILAVMFLGVGYYLLWALFFGVENLTLLESVWKYFLAGSALFAPYAFNQLSGIFKN